MVVTPSKKESPKETFDMEAHLNKIRQLESSGGRNDNCLSKGKINGYGYMQSTFHWECFKSHIIVRSKVANWFDDKFKKGMSLAESICYYNTGHKIKTCPYWQKYQSL